MDGEIGKRGQMTIWIILAIFLAAAILLFFFIDRPRTEIETIKNPDLQPYLIMRTCVEKYIDISTKEMMPHGGMIVPKNYVIYNSTPVEMICDNKGYFKPCVQQHPMLVNEIEMQLENYLYSNIAECYNQLRSETAKRGGSVDLGANPETIDIELSTEKISVDIKREMTFEEKGVKRKVGEFEIDIPKYSYDLAKIAMEVASEEARWCNFEQFGFSLAYPEFTMKKYRMSAPVRVYTVTHKKSGEFIMFGIRSCAIPSGLPG